MNLALHGLLLQVFASILNFQHGAFLCSAGEPGYLDFDNLPETNFSCQGKVIGGYYADVEAGCQMFHVCTIGQKDEIMDIKFLCLNGTVFDQETRVCERVDEVDCSKSERFYNLNLELYGNNAVTLSLHENTEEEEEDPLDSLDDHQQRTTSARPTTTTSTTTTTSRPSKPSSTPSSVPYPHPTGYPQHYQPQPPFPQVHTSQSKSLYDDKNGGYHHQYIFHNGERSNSQATSYQLFSSQGVSSTTVQAPHVHQIRYSSTSTPQIIHNEPSTVTPLFHTSSTIQTLLNSNGNSPALINPIFHNHGIASTTEQFSIHNNNPRDTSEYRDGGEQSIRPLEAVQSTSKGKVSKLTISPVPIQESQRIVQPKQNSQQRIPSGFLPTPASIETTIRSFYPTPRSSSSKSTQAAQSSGTQHIHVPPPVAIPQLKPHQITINLPPPDIQRIIQSPSPLLPSQSRVIVTAKASVSDESGRPLNSSQLVTLPLPTIPASYDDYKEGDESFDPFYRDVPKIRSNRKAFEDDDVEKSFVRRKRALGPSRTGPFVYDADRESGENLRVLDIDEKQEDISDLRSIKESLSKFRKFLFNEEQREDEEEAAVRRGGQKAAPLKDLAIGATRNLKARKLDEAEYDADDNDELEAESKESADSAPDGNQKEESAGVTEGTRRKSRYRMVQSDLDSHESEKSPDEEAEIVPDPENRRVLDVVILSANERVRTKSENLEEEASSTNLPVISTSEEVTQPSVEETTTVLPEKEVDAARKSSKKKDSEAENLDQATQQKNSGERREQKPGAKRISARIKSRGRTLRRKQQKNNSVERQKVEKNETTESPSSLEGSIGKIDSHIFKEEDSQALKDLGTRAVDQRNRNAVKDSQERKSHSSKNKDDVDSKNYTEKDIKIEEEHHEELVDLKDKDDLDSKDYKEKEDVQIEDEHHEEHVDLEDKDLDSKEKEDTWPEENHEKHVDLNNKDLDSEEKEDIWSEENHEEHIDLKNKDLDSEEKEDIWPEENHDKPSESSSITPSINEEDTMTEIPAEVEEKEETSNNSEIPDNEHHEYKEEIAIEHHEAVEDVETTIKKTSPEGDVETSSIHESKQSSRLGKSMKFEESSSKETTSHRQDKSRKFDDYDDEETSKESSTVTTIEAHKTSEETSEFFTESSLETQEFSGEEDDPEAGSEEASTTSTEEDHSEEVSSSQEANTEETEDTSTQGDDEPSTEGVLKFTDELPKPEHKDDSVESLDVPESTESISQDYVDDNYEPENYKEREDSAESNELSYDKDSKDLSEDSEVREDRSDYSESTTLSEEVSDEGSLGSEEEYARTLEKQDIKEEIEENTTILTTSSSTTTTTMRPKLFKPIAARKNYNYIPPTTTPNPVIIKPRIPLLNPKPARPLKSYNDLVPKPVIRKHPLLTRKYTTTTASTTTEVERPVEEVATTEVITTTTENPRSDENILESKLETKEQVEVHTPKNEASSDQEPSSSQEKSLSNASVQEEKSSKAAESFTPYPLVRISTLATTIGKILEEAVTVPSVPEDVTTPKLYTLLDLSIINTTTDAAITLAPEKPEVVETTTLEVMIEELTSTVEPPVSKDPEPPVTESPTSSTSAAPVTSTPETEIAEDASKPTTMRLFHRKPLGARRHSSFNCLEKEMYRFYGDKRDCRLFHYCSPGFTSRQVLDFRFVCEEGTAFDEESQSCRHDVRKEKCPNRSW